jgi:hypothetical protein
MLEISITNPEMWDEEKQEFLPTKTTTIQLEHSLVSLSKWEAKWSIPFLGKNGAKEEKTNEQIIDYIRCMTITQNVKPNIYLKLTNANFLTVKEYIEASMTATWFSEKGLVGAASRPNETVTAEIIYYWMIAQNIPMECQKWHLNRLLTLIRVCSIKNAPPKQRKTSQKDTIAQRRALNESRRAQLNSKG